MCAIPFAGWNVMFSRYFNWRVPVLSLVLLFHLHYHQAVASIHFCQLSFKQIYIPSVPFGTREITWIFCACFDCVNKYFEVPTTCSFIRSIQLFFHFGWNLLCYVHGFICLFNVIIAENQQWRQPHSPVWICKWCPLVNRFEYSRALETVQGFTYRTTTDDMYGKDNKV